MKFVRYRNRDYTLSANRLFSVGDLANLQRLAYAENALEVAKEEVENAVQKALSGESAAMPKAFTRLETLQRQAAGLREKLTGVIA